METITKYYQNSHSFWENYSLKVVKCTENMFYSLGLKVAQSPWCTISISLVFVAISTLGLLNFHHEKNPIKLWVPENSDFAKDTNWILNRFGEGFRQQRILITAPNVLLPSVVIQLHEISKAVMNISITNNNKTYSWFDLCFKVPIITFGTNKGSKRRPDRDTRTTLDFPTLRADKEIMPPQNEIQFDPSIIFDTSFYCNVIETFQTDCLQYNILDLWKYDLATIRNLTTSDILVTLNETTVSPTLGHPIDYQALLGGVQRNKENVIISAQSVMLIWYAHVNFSEVDSNTYGNMIGTEEWVSEATRKWESNFLDLLDDWSSSNSDIKLYYQAGRSFADISEKTMFQDVTNLTVGIILMFVYIQIVLSKLNWLEVRLTLGSVGLLSVGMAFICACGWCSALGIAYGPVHTSLPFLLMGLGVDDMFVMKACWEQLDEKYRTKSLPIQVGLMLKHAGVSIVITSFTDIVAFLIGSITVLPSLHSFCLYAAAGVFFIFCFSVTFYVSVFTLDVQRVNAKRNCLIACYTHNNYIHTTQNKSIFHKMFLLFYKRIVFSFPMKILIIASTIFLAVFNTFSLLKLEQKFDPNWFIPNNTYLADFLYEEEFYYPNNGFQGSLFTGSLNYTEEMPLIYNTIEKISDDPSIRDIDSWTLPLRDYVLTNFHKDVRFDLISDKELKTYLSKFLFSPQGAKYQMQFRFSKKLECGQPSHNIILTSINFNFVRFHGPSEYLPAMNRLKHIVKNCNLTTGDKFITIWSKKFANWVTDEIIGVEVERNLELALVCVMGCTIILITNLHMCFWIFICVLFTLVNVCGFMQMIGMTVDVVSCIGLELAVGLCVDYAAHIGHTFLTVSGASRQDRAFVTVSSVGLAVLYGGGSTLLSLSMLSRSSAYMFSAFFKIFLFVVIFGLFHGLIFLPVLLSFIGPPAYNCKKVKITKIADPNNEMEIVELNSKSVENIRENVS